MLRADEIKYVPVVLISLSLVTIIFLVDKLKSQIIPGSGVVTSVFPIPFYLDVLTHVPGGDGQAGLIFAVMPVYQLVGLAIFSAIGYGILAVKNHFTNR